MNTKFISKGGFNLRFN